MVKATRLEDVKCPACKSEKHVIFNNESATHWCDENKKTQSGPKYSIHPWVEPSKAICYCKECERLFEAIYG